MKIIITLTCLLSAGEITDSAQKIDIDDEDILANVWRLPTEESVSSFRGDQLLQVARLKALQAATNGTFYGLVNVDRIIVPEILTRYHEAFTINKHSGNHLGYQILYRSFNDFIKEIKKSKREKINTEYPQSFSRAIKYTKTPDIDQYLPKDLKKDLVTLNIYNHFTKKSLQQAQDLLDLIKTDFKVD